MPSMNAQPATGHCLCGAVRFEVLAGSIVVSLCHCESCRRHIGSTAAPFAIFRKDAVRWSGAERTGSRPSCWMRRTMRSKLARMSRGIASRAAFTPSSRNSTRQLTVD